MHLKTLLRVVVFDAFALASINKSVCIYCFCKRTIDGFKPNNWGDDFNFVLIEELSKQKVVPINNTVLFRKTKKPVYSCIGSILGSINFNWLPSLEVWGSGFKHYDDAVVAKPAVIHSVRGPLTRDIYLRHGIDCPAIYGEPGLLVSRIYKPSSEKKYKLGIVAHYNHNDSVIINEFVANHPECLLIDMRHYTDWHDIPDQICACERVLSSSLHGLVVADSYGVPNRWFSIPEMQNEDEFKFRDYMLSVHREDLMPLSVDGSDVLNRELYGNSDYECARNIDFDGILQSCPFVKRGDGRGSEE